MAYQVEKDHMKSVLLSEGTCSVKEEQCEGDDFADDKVHVFTNAVSVNNGDLKDYAEHTNNKNQFEVSTNLDSIKTELSSFDLQCNTTNDNIKIEEEIRDVEDIKIKFESGQLYCENCCAYYKDYCIKCGMLVHILNKNILNDQNNKARELPSNILEIQESFGQLGIFALKVIPERVRFGPFIDVSGPNCPLKIKRGKFVMNTATSQYINWMQYINSAGNIFEQNLLVLQCENNIYYQSTCQILEGDELLVYFGDHYKDSVNNDSVMDFIPNVKDILEDVFACAYCCLGFSSKSYLVKHKTICLVPAAENRTIKDLMQCPSCKIHFDQNEYIHNHMAYCCERQRFPPTMGDQTTEANARTIRRSRIYKCERCKYATKYKVDLHEHGNKHYRVKTYKCGTCSRRFKTKESVRLHEANTHVCVGAEEDPEHSIADYKRTQIKIEASRSAVNVKRLRCSRCDFRAKYKSRLNRHITTKHLKGYNYKRESCAYQTMTEKHLKIHTKTKHLREFDYKCASCAYETNWKRTFEYHVQRHRKEFDHSCDRCDYKTNKKWHLRCHVKTKHLQEFNYGCRACTYRTGFKSNLEAHVRSTHFREFNYKCRSCTFKTNTKSKFEVHTKSVHLKKFDYRCDSCEFETNTKNYLERHIKTKHLSVFNYKCELCTYRTNSKSLFEGHVKAKHLKHFNYKCDLCEYGTNRKDHLARHIKTKHLKQFDYKCDACNYAASCERNLDAHVRTAHLKERACDYKCERCSYKSSRKSLLECHIKTIHLKEFDYKCELCSFKTNVKSRLDSHIKTIHLKEFNYKCALCEYRTNRKGYFEKHVKSKHLDEFDRKRVV